MKAEEVVEKTESAPVLTLEELGSQYNLTTP